ncbi:replication protein RepA [Escherichia coli]|uniref:replication protein RepA n=1 Tax=Escherichia coli TaxID=562 RepID=UPI001E4CA8F4|nr:replication protein RepA [Escherichia coli]MCC4710860.1 replication protein [Escherichia coli]
MTNLSKNGGRQTALDLGDSPKKGADAFDEAAYRAELIAAGIPAGDAAAVAAKTAEARRQRDYVPGNVGASLKLPAAVKDAVQRVERAQEKATPAKKASAGRALALSKQEGKLLEVATDIATTPPSGEDMAFTHAVLCQVGLPRAKVEGREFMRQSGQAWVNVQAGWLDEGKGPVQQPIPYGVMPRLALAWVSTFAVRHGTREIPIGDSAADFLRLMLGADTASQGARYTTLRKQMHALAACRLQLGFRGRTFNGQPVEQFDAWVSNRDSQQKPLWPGVMTLSEHYFNELRDSAVPLDNRALHALKGSALALDVYAWLAHRLHRIEGKGVVLHWKSLREQFAQEYKGKDPDKDFKKEFLPVLRKVQAVYPSANVKQVTGGLLLLGSPPPIPKKLTK